MEIFLLNRFHQYPLDGIQKYQKHLLVICHFLKGQFDKNACANLCFHLQIYVFICLMIDETEKNKYTNTILIFFLLHLKLGGVAVGCTEYLAAMLWVIGLNSLGPGLENSYCSSSSKWVYRNDPKFSDKQV